MIATDRLAGTETVVGRRRALAGKHAGRIESVRPARKERWCRTVASGKAGHGTSNSRWPYIAAVS
jgi:hypothetical protein